MISNFASGALPALLLLGGLHRSAAQTFRIDTRQNIVASASTLAYDLMTFYKGNQSGEIPGLLPGPPPLGDYYWWEGAGLMGTYIDYWHLTGDATYNQVVTEGMLHQVGPNNDYMTPNYTATMGNDDQCFWGISALLAAENGLPNPPQGKPQWLTLAKNVFDVLTIRAHSENTCNGGLRWQVMPTNVGYNYKNSKYIPMPLELIAMSAAIINA
jgi:mannan endo-1,6-alpha-mannosidase